MIATAVVIFVGVGLLCMITIAIGMSLDTERQQAARRAVAVERRRLGEERRRIAEQSRYLADDDLRGDASPVGDECPLGPYCPRRYGPTNN